MHEVPIIEKSSLSTKTDENPVAKEYLEQLNLLRQERIQNDTTSLDRPQNFTTVGKAPSNTQQKKPGTNGLSIDLNIQNLTKADFDAIKKINVAHVKFDSDSSGLSADTINVHKTKIVLEELFKAELRNKYPTISDPDIDVLVKKLKTTMSAQLKGDLRNSNELQDKLKLYAQK